MSAKLKQVSLDARNPRQLADANSLYSFAATQMYTNLLMEVTPQERGGIPALREEIIQVSHLVVGYLFSFFSCPPKTDQAD